MDDYQWSDWSESIQESFDVCGMVDQCSSDVQTVFDTPEDVADLGNHDYDSISALINYESWYINLIVNTVASLSHDSSDKNDHGTYSTSVKECVDDKDRNLQQSVANRDGKTDYCSYDYDSNETLIEYESAYIQAIENIVKSTNHDPSAKTEAQRYPEEICYFSSSEDYDSIMALINYETMYESLILSCEQGRPEILNQQANKITEGVEEESFDELDSVPLAEWINRLVDERSVDMDETLDYTIIVEEENVSHLAEESHLLLETSHSNDKDSFCTSHVPEETVNEQYMPIRGKGWKRRGKRKKSNLNRKHIRMSDNDQTDNEEQQNNDTESSENEDVSSHDKASALEKAVNRSIKEMKLQKTVLAYHAKRLDKLLSSNMLICGKQRTRKNTERQEN